MFFTGKKCNRFIEAILKEYDYCKKVIKKNVNKKWITSAEDKQKFQTSNKCCIFDKLFDVGDNKVREHCYMTGKYRGYAHWRYNIYLKLT